MPIDAQPQSQSHSDPTTPESHADEWTVARILDWTSAHLAKHGSDSPRRDAEILLAHARRCKRIELYTRYAERPTANQRATMRDLVRRRAAAEPVAYLVGFKEFYSLPFAVNPDVLIPRPETETLVLEAVDFAKAAEKPELRLLDLCCGSGCVAIAATKEFPGFQTTATDLSPAALAVARANAQRNGLANRIEFREGDLFDAIVPESRFDVITANPPYVSQEEFETLPPTIRNHEPKTALAAASGGFEFLEKIARQAPAYLNPGGLLLMELSPEQADPVAAWLRENLCNVKTLKDLSGTPRLASGQKSQ